MAHHYPSPLTKRSESARRRKLRTSPDISSPFCERGEPEQALTPLARGVILVEIMRRADLVRGALLSVCAAILITSCSSGDDDAKPGKGGSGGHGGTSGSGGTSGGGTGGIPDAGPDTSGCSSDGDCASPTPRCQLTTHACVACLSGDTDNCPSDEYCDATSSTCVSGCKNAQSCPSQVCDSTHQCAACMPETPDSGADSGTVDLCPDGKYCTSAHECIQGCKLDGTSCARGSCDGDHGCNHCLNDSECAGGKLCSSGTCLDACGDGGVTCPADFECCSGRCAKTKSDFGYCGSCSNACSGEQFCNGSSCGGASISAVCSAPKVTFVKDRASVDDQVTDDVRAAFNHCANSQIFVVANQTESDVMNPVTGQPVGGSGNLVVMLGGTYFQHMIRYLEEHALTRVHNNVNNLGTIIGFYTRGQDGGADPAIVEDSATELSDPNASRGYFLIESVVDPTSHTWALEIYGLGAQGTSAGAWFFANKVIPKLNDFPAHYYIYKWVDAGAEGGSADAGPPMPSEDDTFTQLASAP
jgi:hypothetical protein